MQLARSPHSDDDNTGTMHAGNVIVGHDRVLGARQFCDARRQCSPVLAAWSSRPPGQEVVLAHDLDRLSVGVSTVCAA